MSPAVEQQLAELLRIAAESLKRGGEIAQAQLPQAVADYIAFGRVWYPCLAVFIVVLTALVIWRAFVAFGRDRDRSLADSSTADVMVSVFGGIFGGLGVIVSVFTLRSALLAWIAPHAWLLEQIAKLSCREIPAL